MSPQQRADFEKWLSDYARKRGLWVMCFRELLSESFAAGTYYESQR